MRRRHLSGAAVPQFALGILFGRLLDALHAMHVPSHEQKVAGELSLLFEADAGGERWLEVHVSIPWNSLESRSTTPLGSLRSKLSPVSSCCEVGSGNLHRHRRLRR